MVVYVAVKIYQTLLLSTESTVRYSINYHYMCSTCIILCTLQAVLDVVANLQFQMVENLWQAFWVDTSRSSRYNLPFAIYKHSRFVSYNSDIQSDDDQDHRLSKEKLIVLTSCQPLLDYLVACDHILYQCIVNFLISNVLRPIPATLTQAIRNFAKNLESWMSSSLEGYPTKCVQAKVCHYMVSLLCHLGNCTCV